MKFITNAQRRRISHLPNAHRCALTNFAILECHHRQCGKLPPLPNLLQQLRWLPALDAPANKFESINRIVFKAVRRLNFAFTASA